MGGTQLAGRTYRAVVDVEDLWWGSIPTIRFTHLTEASELPLSLGRPRWAGRRASNPQPTAHGLVQREAVGYLGWGPGHP